MLIAKLNALFPTLSSPSGCALAQFPKFVLEDKHRSIQIFNVGATDKEFWEVKSWRHGDVSVIHVLHLMKHIILPRNSAAVRVVWDERFPKLKNTRVCRQGSGSLNNCTRSAKRSRRPFCLGAEGPSSPTTKIKKTR